MTYITGDDMDKFGQIRVEFFGSLPDGTAVWKVGLHAQSGLSAEILTFGAILHSLRVPTDTGEVDVVLGKENLEDYLKFGLCNSGVVGRYANRIAGGTFMLAGEQIRLEQNLGQHCIHGGSGCYMGKNFAFSVVQEPQTLRLHLTCLDDGAGGFPGQLCFSVDYVLSNDTLRLEYCALPTHSTPWNVTSHAYFDLNGHGSGATGEHMLQINADAVLYTSPDGIPQSVPVKVADTSFDFRKPRLLRDALSGDEPQLRQQGGFDHNFCLNDIGCRRAAVLHGCRSNITMEVWTDQPGMQLFTLNTVPFPIQGKDGRQYSAHGAICLETQQYPNAVNEPGFPNPIIPAGQLAKTVTEYRFNTDRTKGSAEFGRN